MSPAPFVTVCIANFRGEQVLKTCLNSVLAQECDFAFEVIVFDDASDDASLELLAENYPEIRVIAVRENVGYCIANWRMVEAARGIHVLLLNNDAWLLPGSLQALGNAARGDGAGSILGLPQFNGSTGMLEDRGRFCDFFLNSVPNLDPAKRDVAMVAGACLWIRRDLWFELGGFPTWFGSTAEDLFLCCAARLRGMRVQVVDGPGFFHLIGHSLGGSAVGDRVLVTSKSRRFRSERNKIAVMVACYPAACLLLALPLLVASLLFEGLALSLMQNDSSIFSDIYWRALVCAWAERKRMLEMRRKRSVAMRSFFSVFVWIPYKLRMLWRYGIPQIK